MSKAKLRRAGRNLLIIGCLMLVIGIVLTTTIGTILVPLMLSGSILVNTIGVSLVWHNREPVDNREQSGKTNKKRPGGKRA